MTEMAALYAKIPTVDCIPGCTDCCGVIPLALIAERRNFGKPGEMIYKGGHWMTRKLSCVHSKAGNCGIHDKRPFMCRLFGTVDPQEADEGSKWIVCPHGRKPAVPLTGDQARALTAEYFELVAKEKAQ